MGAEIHINAQVSLDLRYLRSNPLKSLSEAEEKDALSHSSACPDQAGQRPSPVPRAKEAASDAPATSPAPVSVLSPQLLEAASWLLRAVDSFPCLRISQHPEREGHVAFDSEYQHQLSKLAQVAMESGPEPVPKEEPEKTGVPA
ncbi:hypothetical protein MJT46_013655 [Ovis ammon polii x Ovis aries]|nr:hypothetical protein MJT46_013655 [Ovis ammon polii x Ovis aries]